MAAPRVLLCVTGGIAAYRALELVRRFRRAGWDPVVAMTRHACRLVGPESFAALSGNPVALDLFPDRRPDDGPARMAHIDLPASAGLAAVVPATANILGKLASGIADDLVSTLLLAVPSETVTAGRAILAPAMNRRMWQHPAVRRNVAALRGWGYRFVGPDEGELACGEQGEGRLADVESLFAACRGALEDEPLPDLAGAAVVVTTGRTEEPLDPVRLITNRSSGLMGVELARAFAAAGASVRLVAGPTSVPVPASLAVTRVRTSAEMLAAVRQAAGGADALIMCAAVADYRPARASRQKGHAARLSLALRKTPDILKQVSRIHGSTVLVGFSHDPSVTAARAKLRDKGLDLVVANPYRTAGSDAITPVIVRAQGRSERCGTLPKWRFARRLVREVSRLLRMREEAERG